MLRKLDLPRRVAADLRNYPNRCLALEADGECVVCWKVPDSEARILSDPDVTILVRLVYSEWDVLDPLTGAKGDTLSLFCHTENYASSGLARLEKKQVVEDLTRQDTLPIFILDERLSLLDERRIHWDEGKRREAGELLGRFLSHLESDPLRYHDFVRPNSALQIKGAFSPSR
jgi:hypothetical protein